MTTRPTAPAVPPLPAPPEGGWLQRSAARRVWVASAVLAMLWLALVASMSAVD